MKKCFGVFVLLFLGLLLGCIFCETESQVVHLNTENFESLTSTGKWFIKFYAPWCGHCKRLAPTWNELAEASTSAKIASVDCTQFGPLCTAFGVKGFPTLKFIADGKVYTYKGARTIEKFNEFIEGSFTESETEPIPNLKELPQEVNNSNNQRSEVDIAIQQVAIYGKKNFTELFFITAASCLVFGVIAGILLDQCTRPGPPKVARKELKSE